MAKVLWAILWVWCAGAVAAERGSLFALPEAAATAALISAPAPAAAPHPAAAPPHAPERPRRGAASLFAGPKSGFFEPLPDPPADPPSQPSGVVHGTGTTQVDQLLSLIARAEAGSAGYDAVQYGARIRPTKPPTQMTLGEIYAWIAATPGQPHAIGRYQFIPSTLRRVAQVRGFGPETRFTPGVQDALALVLLEDAGLADFRAGRLGRVTFMRNLAKIWAGLPLPNGKSYYEGHAGNSATMSWARFEGGMARIWPVRG